MATHFIPLSSLYHNFCPIFPSSLYSTFWPLLVIIKLSFFSTHLIVTSLYDIFLNFNAVLLLIWPFIFFTIILLSKANAFHQICYIFEANVIPSNNSSKASKGKRFETAIETVICFGVAFIAQMSDTFATTALYPKCFNGI